MRPKAFVIDDNDLDLRLLSKQLGQESVEVVSYSGGRAAIAEVGASSPSACIVDIYMPDMDGFEVIRQLRRDGYEGLVVAITGGMPNPEFDVLKYAEAFGADMVLRKPINPGQIRQAIANDLGDFAPGGAA